MPGRLQTANSVKQCIALNGLVRHKLYKCLRGLHMLTEKQLQADGGIVLGTTPPAENRATAPISMDAFYAQPITLESFMGNAHNAQAQTATTAKRTRRGVNSQYQRLNGTIALRGFAQALGLRTGWKGKAHLEKACAVLHLFGFVPPANENAAIAAENVRRFKESVKTNIADGASKGYYKDGVTPYKDYKPAALSPELLAQLDDAIMFVQTAKPAAV